MFCDKCGKEFDDGAEFCPYCGDSTKEEKAVIEKKNKKSRRKLYIICAAAVAAIAAVIALIIAFSNLNEKVAIKYADAVVMGNYSKFKKTLVINYDKAFDEVFTRVNKDEEISNKEGIKQICDAYGLEANNTKQLMASYFTKMYETANKDNDIVSTKAKIKDADKLEKKELFDKITDLENSLKLYGLDPAKYFAKEKITEGYKIELEIAATFDSGEVDEFDYDVYVVKHKGSWKVIESFVLPPFMAEEYPTCMVK